MASVVSSAKEVLGPSQVGVAVHNGCEATVHFLASKLAPGNLPKSHALLKTDLSNAFNRVSRPALFQAVDELIPALGAWVRWAYGQQAPLFMKKEYDIKSCEGVRQGDPLGPLLFSLVLKRLTDALSAQFPNLYANVWYLDDGNIVAPIKMMPEILSTLEEIGQPLGLHLNRKKSELWSPHFYDEEVTASIPSSVSDSVTVIREEGIEILGAPIGSAAYIRAKVAEKVDELERKLELTKHLKDPQLQFSLAKRTLNNYKLNFWSRTCPPEYILDELRRVDTIWRDYYFTLLGSDLSDLQFLQSTLPLASGGLGIQSAEAVSNAAFVGSLYDSFVLQKSLDPRPESFVARPETPVSVQNLKSALSLSDERMQELMLSGKLQRQLTDIINLQRLSEYERLLTSPALRAKHESQKESRGRWINVIPNESFGTVLKPLHFITRMKLHMGFPIFSGSDVGCGCALGPTPPNMEYHALSCKRDGSRYLRHNAIRDVFFDACSAGKLSVLREPPNLIPDSDERPGDVYFPLWKDGKPMAVDFTVSNCCRPSDLDNIADNPTYVILDAAEKKRRKYQARLEDLGINFTPFCMDVYGSMHNDAFFLLQRVASSIATNTGFSWQDTRKYLMEKLQIALATAVSTSLISRSLC